MALQKFTKDGFTFTVNRASKDTYIIDVQKKDDYVFSGLYPNLNDLKRNFVVVQELFLGKAKVKLNIINETAEAVN
jgi:hypothetical protein